MNTTVFIPGLGFFDMTDHTSKIKAGTATTPSPPTPTPKAKFKPGDVVMLNSGSPDMTVEYETDGKVQVVYFPETDSGAYCEQPLHACFPAVCLSAIPTDEMN
jgi:uncharacterized protein YodC (DUF2158 family)